MERTDLQPLNVVLHPSHPRGVDAAFRSLDSVELIEPAEADLVAALQDADVLVTYRWEPAYLTERLRWIQSISAGVSQFPTDRLRDAGVVLTSASGVHGPQVAEHAFALLLAMTRAVGVSMRDAVAHRWKSRMGYEIAGSTMAVLGLGTIGEEIARRADAWGMKVIGTKQHPDRYRGIAARVGGAEDTVAICSAADIVVSVLPDAPSTRGIVDADVLAAIGPGWFVNVGRGSVVDESALIHALNEGELRGAGLDVFAEEPLPDDSPLWDHPRVVLTPHNAGFSPHYGARLVELFEHNRMALAGAGEWRGRVV